MLVDPGLESESVLHYFIFLKVIYFDSAGSLLLPEGAFLWCRYASSLCSGFSCCRAQARVRAQESGLTDSVVRWPVGSSQTRDQTHVPCIGRQILKHWASSEVLYCFMMVDDRHEVCTFQSNLLSKICQFTSLLALWNTIFITPLSVLRIVN